MPEAFDLVVWLARHAGRGRRPSDLALVAFGDGLPVPERTVRAALRAAVESVALSVEMDEPPVVGADPEELDNRAERVADRAVASGLTVTLVPARARRIDERIARRVRDAGVTWPPPELAALDRNPERSRLTASDATAAAVTAMLRGGATITPQGIGDLFRAMQPDGPSPIASLAEFTHEDVHAPSVFEADGGAITIPHGDVRDVLCGVADAASLDDLRAAWQAAQDLHDWAIALCERVEAELETGTLGPAVTDWVHIRAMPACMFLLAELRGRRRFTPSAHANSALMLLMTQQAFRVLDALVPDCQWDLLNNPVVLPPVLHPLLASRPLP